jgi:serine/threonine-protein kinase
MNDIPASRPITGPAAQLSALWQQSPAPDLAAFLEQAGTLSAEQLATVLCVDQRQRWLRGERPPAEDYLRLYACHHSDPEFAVDLLFGEFLVRRLLGETPAVEEYRQRFPDLAEQLAVQIQLSDAFPATKPPSIVTKGPGGAVTARETGVEAQAPFPALLGRYELLEEIGRGGMGAVLRGRDPDLGRDLALKVLLPEHQHDQEVLCRFTEEAQIGGQLQHPGIVPVYEVGRSAEQLPYFTMKLVKGRTLAALLRERSGAGQDLPRFLHIFESVCQTMAYAHSKRVIHRDLKPANIMVGAFGEVQVMDWGLAKVLEDAAAPRAGSQDPATPASVVLTVRSSNATLASRYGTVIGTPAYMAPEQAAGQPDRLDERCDVFGLGAILCEILTGQPPFGGAATLDVLLQAWRGGLAEAFARLERSGADEELVDLTRACLGVDRDSRPRHAGLVAERVRAYQAAVQERLRQAELERAEAMARAESESRQRQAAQAQTRAERRALRLTVGLAALVLLTVLAGGGAWLWWTQERAERERQARALQTELTEQAEEALAQASNLRGQARAEGSTAKWAEARAQASRAATLLERLSEPTALGERVSALLRELDDEEDDRRLVALLDEVRLVKAEDHPSHWLWFKLESAAPRYAEALRPFGVLDLTVPPEQAAARIRARPAHVRAQLVAALDDWIRLISEANGEQARRLEAVVNEADTDPWRQRLRAARRKKDRKALEDLAGEVGVEGQPPETLQLLALILWYNGARSDAVSLLRRAQAQYPGDFWINYTLGWYLVQYPEQRVAALRFLTAAAALRPNSPTPLCLMGGALGETGDWAGGLAVFQRAVTLKPEIAVAHCGLGTGLLLSRNDLEGASAAFRRALALDPDFIIAHVNLGHTLSRKGDRDGAIASWRRALALKPDASLQSLLVLEEGRVHAGRREWQKAVACYEQSVKLNSTKEGNFGFEFPAVLLLSGDEAGYRKSCVDLLQRGPATSRLRPYLVARVCTLAAGAAEDVARAARLAEEELKAGSKGAWSLTQQAALHHRAGRLAEALPLLEKSLKADNKPGSAVLNWLWLALTYQRLGKTQEARSWLEKATKWLDQFGDGLPARSEQELGLHLHSWLEAHILRREAEALLEAPATQRK